VSTVHEKNDNYDLYSHEVVNSIEFRLVFSMFVLDLPFSNGHLVALKPQQRAPTTHTNIIPKSM